MDEELYNINNAMCRGEYKLSVYERYALHSRFGQAQPHMRLSDSKWNKY